MAHAFDEGGSASSKGADATCVQMRHSRWCRRAFPRGTLPTDLAVCGFTDRNPRGRTGNGYPWRMSMRFGPLLLALVTCACSGKTAQKSSAPKPCEKFGDTCEFSPGKLGACVERTNCSGSANCLICQSQH